MAHEDERQRRLRQQRELVHGSGVPSSVVRALSPGVAPRAARKRWKDMGRAERYALIQSQLIMWALVLVVAYLLAVKLSVVLGIAYLALLVAGVGYFVLRVRNTREP